MATSPNIISQQELANRFGVSPVTIRNWENKTFDDSIGPFPVAQVKGTTKEYPWKECLLWYIKYYAFTELRDALYSPEVLDFAKTKAEGDARKSMAAAKLAELDLQTAQNLVAPVADFEQKLSEVALMIRQKIETLPPRFTVLLSLDDEQKELVELEKDNILKELSKLK